MKVFATIVIANKNKSAAQDLTSSNMFISEYKKGLRKYWVSSGYFSQNHYDLLVDSGLIFAMETNQGVKPSAALVSLELKKVIEE